MGRLQPSPLSYQIGWRLFQTDITFCLLCELATDHETSSEYTEDLGVLLPGPTVVDWRWHLGWGSFEVETNWSHLSLLRAIIGEMAWLPAIVTKSRNALLVPP